jgi:hypothetical protein
MLNGPLVFFGFIFLVPGILGIIIQNWIFSGINLFIAWFLFLSYSGVEINTEKKVFRNYTKLFGLIKTGKWKPVNHYMGLTLVSMKKVYTMYSRSNRRNTSSEKDFRIYFVNKAKKPAIPIKICKTLEQAQNSIDEFSIWLHLPVYSVKNS